MATETVKKITKRDRYNELLELNEVQERPELVEFINHEIELLTKKQDGKPTKTQEENAAYAEAILAYLADGEKHQVADITKNVAMLAEADVKSQRVTHIMTTLAKDGKVVNIKEKGKSYYALPDAE